MALMSEDRRISMQLVASIDLPELIRAEMATVQVRAAALASLRVDLLLFSVARVTFSHPR